MQRLPSPEPLRRIRWILPCLLLSGLASAASGGGTLAVSGTVAGEDDGLPIVGRYVLAYSGQQFLGSTSTDASGAYRIEGLAPGSIWLKTGTTAPGDLHMDETHVGALCPFGECPTPSSGQLVVLEDGQPEPVVDFQLPLGGSLAGSVTDEVSGATLLNTWVSLLYDNGEFAESARVFSGGYAFKAFPPGIYHAKTSGPQPYGNYIPEIHDDIVCLPNGCDRAGATEIVVTAGQVATVDFQLELGGSMSGLLVTDENTPDPGTPIPGSITYFDENGDLVFNAFASNGSWIARALPAGTYYLRSNTGSGYYNEIYEDILFGNGHSAEVTDGTPVQVVAGQETTGIDFRLPSGAAIEGKLTDALTGEPIPHFYVRAIRVDTRQAPQSEGAQRGLDGTYRLEPLDDGVYEVSASSQDDAYLSQVYPEHLELSVNEVASGIDFALYPTATIRGRILDHEGQPIPGAWAGVRTLDENDTFFNSREASPDGTYAITGLAPRDDYLLLAWAPRKIPVLHPDIVCHFSNCAFELGTRVELDYGDLVTDIDFVLDPAARIEATVVEVGSGAPISNVGVRVFDDTGLSLFSSGTDEDGRATLDGLPPDGTYRLAVTWAQGYYFELWENRPYYYSTDFSEPREDVLEGTPISFSAGEDLVEVLMDLDNAETAPELSAEVFVVDLGGGLLSTTEGYLHCRPESDVYCSTRAFPTGATATLVAVPDPGSEFQAFGGDPDCLDGVVEMSGDVHCTATFAGEPPLFADGFESGDVGGW